VGFELTVAGWELLAERGWDSGLGMNGGRCRG
jgi:hypothetical protein